MIDCYSKFTVCFEAPFWIGIYERVSDGKLSVSKVTFGAEPKDYEVYHFLLKNWHKFKFSPQIKAQKILTRCINPKRLQREIQKSVSDNGIGTKSQQALKLMHEDGKLKRKEIRKKKKEEEKDVSFRLHQLKRKDKHKGH